MYNYYSRRTKTEERKNFRKAIFLILLSITTIGIFVIFGLPFVAKFAAFLTDLRSSSTPVESNDTTPPIPPRFESLPEFTKNDKVEIKGSSEPGSTIKLLINDEKEELLTNTDGEFNYTFTLVEGENTISGISVDSSGNESVKTKVFLITLDKSTPSLDVVKPSNGSQFFGPRERQLVIEGKTEKDAAININGRLVVVENDGSFTFATTLSQGENKFNIKAQDRAENISEKEVIVSYEP